jgi:hypothetical protein
VNETIARSSLRGRALVGWVSAFLLVVIGLSILVGYLGPKPGFQWELASIFGTALGTTLLAAATGALAYSTWSDVRATWQLAELTRRDQDERARPVVLVQTSSFGGSGASGGRYEGSLDVALRNVGLGPALRVELRADYSDDEYGATVNPNPTVCPAIAPNETVNLRVGVVFPERSPTTIDAGDFALGGTFTDRSRQGNYAIITGWSEPDDDGVS